MDQHWSVPPEQCQVTAVLPAGAGDWVSHVGGADRGSAFGRLTATAVRFRRAVPKHSGRDGGDAGTRQTREGRGVYGAAYVEVEVSACLC